MTPLDPHPDSPPPEIYPEIILAHLLLSCTSKTNVPCLFWREPYCKACLPKLLLEASDRAKVMNTAIIASCWLSLSLFISSFLSFFLPSCLSFLSLCVCVSLSLSLFPSLYLFFFSLSLSRYLSFSLSLSLFFPLSLCTLSLYTVCAEPTASMTMPKTK